MKALFIGGTGFISTAASRMAVAQGVDLHLLNRGSRIAHVPGSHALTADIHRLEDVRAAVGDSQFDAPAQSLLGVLPRQDRVRRTPDAGVPRRRLPSDDRAAFDDV